MRLNSSCSLAVVLFLVSQSSASAVSITQQAYLKASNTGLDFFGQAVAVSGNTVVIGAPYEASANRNPDDNTAFGAGAAYVFVHDAAGVWTQQAYLKAAHPDPNDQFGFSVAISGDTIVVGANHEASSATGVDGDSTDNSAPGAGAAYVFVREGASWSQQAYLKASNTNTGDRFGASVAISGDTIVVGANSEASNTTGVNGDQLDNSASFSGAAYVFVRSAGLWSQQAYLKASNTNSGDDFGLAVAVSGDTIVVGADTEASNATGVNGDQLNNGAAAAGAAYVFVRSGAAWSQQAYLKASNAEMNDIFGTAVAVSGDTIVVGAPGEASNSKGVNGDQTNNGAPLSGAAYVFVRDGTTWSQQAYLKASNTGANDNLGQSLAISGDTIIVGAYKESSNATGVNGDQTNNMASGSGA
ncbi:MAG TPA: FG-GAP repeat protein, partial [Phycisphaerae bacterium]|nr:FG-GAP repeat protein [Phycisphaerae bacterium]